MNNKDIFSGLEGLGFKDLKDINIYDNKEETNEKEAVEKVEKKTFDEEASLYDKKVVCPVCGTEFFARALKTSAYRMKGRESDFYINYDNVNPYFYDVLLCNVCGYAAMKADFEKIRKSEIELIRQNISQRWNSHEYPSVYNVDIAIERYKLSLLNYTVMGSKASRKAMNCLKLSWMYRLIDDGVNERLFMEQALIGFKDTYFNESLPVYGMDKFAVMYLMGELNRRLGNNEEAIRYFGEVITSRGADKKIKDLARDQRDLVRELSHVKEEVHIEEVVEVKKKSGLFSKFFK